jgi:hypothetical protein
MADQQYTYSGPASGVSLCEGKGKERRTRSVHLFDGQMVEMPPDHPYTKRLVAQGRLAALKTKGSKPTGTPTATASGTASSGKKDSTP